MSDTNALQVTTLVSTAGIGRLFRQIFADRGTVVATVVSTGIFIAFFVPFVKWALINADFVGSEPKDCRHVGACWVFITSHIGEFAYGFYPPIDWWQVDLSIAFLVIACTAAFLLARRYQIAGAVGAYVLGIVLSFYAFGGELPGMTAVPVARWGGLSITLLLFTFGMGISLIFGGILAFGRRSKRTLIHAVCAFYVEFMRGVPLIAILFIAVILLPLFLPGGAEANMFLRVLVGICLYTSSYMAEAIRAGLDAVPNGSREAAYALGMSYWKREKLVVLPQALIIALPGLINTAIALVKDTSLVILVGMHDLLGATQLAMASVSWGDVLWEGYLFAGVVYFVICWGLSFIGTRIERLSEKYLRRARSG
jgi:general L-amino acid transport system permease protein